MTVTDLPVTHHRGGFRMTTEKAKKLQGRDASLFKYVLGGVYAPLALLLGAALIIA